MDTQSYTRQGRAHVEQNLSADLVVAGGGMAGSLLRYHSRARRDRRGPFAGSACAGGQCIQ